MSYEKMVKLQGFGGEELYKSYGKKQVLRGVTFLPEKGKIVGVLGLNGSGKTTLFKILSGLDGYFSGNVYKTDFEDIAYMSVDNIHSPDMRVKDLVEFYGTFLSTQNTERIRSGLKVASIEWKSRLLSLSTGMRQYVKFLLTVHSGASVCLFDEPLSGLDVNLRDRVVKTMIEEIDESKTFVIATHEIKEFENILDGFYVLNGGKLSPYYESDAVKEETGKSIGEFYKEKVNG